MAAELHDKNQTLHITSPKKWFKRNRESFTCGQRCLPPRRRAELNHQDTNGAEVSQRCFSMSNPGFPRGEIINGDEKRNPPPLKFGKQ